MTNWNIRGGAQLLKDYADDKISIEEFMALGRKIKGWNEARLEVPVVRLMVSDTQKLRILGQKPSMWTRIWRKIWKRN